jgi:hypothetical protein
LDVSTAIHAVSRGVRNRITSNLLPSAMTGLDLERSRSSALTVVLERARV